MNRPAAPHDPFVTCILVVEQPAWLPAAIELFLHQEYLRSELIIVDECPQSVDRTVPPDRRLRYLRLPTRAGCSAGLEYARSQSRGELVVTWETGMWYAPDFLVYVVDGMVRHKTAAFALTPTLHFDPRSDKAWAVQAGAPSGAVLLPNASCQVRLSLPDRPDTGSKAAVRDATAMRAMIGADLRLFGLETESVEITREHRKVPASVRKPGLPSVSAILLSRGGRAALLAIDAFLGQSYKSRELIIVAEDGAAVSELTRDERIRMVMVKPGTSAGARRNLACAQARGRIVVHWDESSWHSPHHIAHVVEGLLRSGAKLCYPDRSLWYDVPSNRAFGWRHPGGEGFRSGVDSLCYRRTLWSKHPFPDSDCGEVSRFVWNLPRSAIAPVPHGGMQVRITGEVSGEAPQGPYWKPHPVDDIRRLLGDAWHAYERELPPEGMPPAAPPPSVIVEGMAEIFRAEPAARHPPAPGRRGRGPLVSCIMPTCNRRRFVPLAIDYFRRQDYEPKELLILDDGADPVSDLVPPDRQIRYFRLESRLSVGAKRNLACERARGDIILHWDDDDWHGPRRIRDSVAALADGRADLCGINPVLFYDLRSGKAWRYAYSADHRLWIYGASFAYRTSLWRQNRFADSDIGEDNVFLWNVPAERIRALSGACFQVSMVHDGNVSPKAVGGSGWTEVPAVDVQRLLADDWARYLAGLPSEPARRRRTAIAADRRPLDLLVGFYVDADASRSAEILECLRRNASNPLIDRVHVLVEEADQPEQLCSRFPDLGLLDVEWVPYGRRLTYRDFFAYANRTLSGRYAVVANADIYFDDSLARLGGCDLGGRLLCLSRWDEQPDGGSRFFDHPASQDAWIFETPIREFPCDFLLGVPGCDNRLAHEAGAAGLAVSNPSRSIRAHHLHASGIRRYSESDRIWGATDHVPATFLGTPWLWFVVPYTGQLGDLRATADAVSAQPDSSYVLVDCSGEDGATAWLKTRPRAKVVKCRGLSGAEARNRGVAAADDDGIVCLLDGDVAPAPEFAEHVLAHFEEGSFLVPAGAGAGSGNCLVCSKTAFGRAGGLDEAFRGWGDEVLDLRASLRRAGFLERTFPSSLVRHPGQPGKPAFSTHAIHAAYRRAKNAILDETGGVPAQVSALREIYEAIARNGKSAVDSVHPPTAACGAAWKQELFALTSLSPSHEHVDVQRLSIKSWRDAGLQVRSFNHPSEIGLLSSFYDVEFVPVTDTSYGTFGRHFVPIGVMLNWAATRDVTAFIINSDIELRMAPWELRRVAYLARDGLCYFLRYNHDETSGTPTREPWGIDAFLFNGEDAGFFQESFLSMGRPFWDYWLPHTMSTRGRPMYAIEYPAAFHRNHATRWSQQEWYRCALEFDRQVGLLGADQSLEACLAMARQVRESFERARIVIPPHPMDVRPWIERTFRSPEPKTFLELGAHCGEDTAWLAELPGVRIHAFEPDPRNRLPPLPNVTVHHAAVSDRDGSSPFFLSRLGWGREWTESSSIKVPAKHLSRYPVTFEGSVQVRTVALDSFCRAQGLGAVDFIWADIQGAEAEMIRGGVETLARTRYLYTEYSDDELYEGQPPLAEILRMLPGFRVLELWPENVLLENTRFIAT